ncbi:MAG: hypothetical protein EZS28_002138 [Streblomastix strix]|uniref:Uncharacterized protein n=1 Tax=Streblomastix strix TaxID=222440 RepID=A0A5J4X5Q1_9EUKA|nr:MAG: hypothetical protein EZS28_002138 [Streblomastix strix]
MQANSTNLRTQREYIPTLRESTVTRSNTSQNDQLKQMILKLKSEQVSDQELVDILRRISDFALESEENLKYVLKQDVISTVNLLYTTTQNKFIKSTCVNIIEVIQKLEVKEEEQEDCKEMGLSLLTMLLSSNVNSSNIGKKNLIVLMESNANSVSGLLSIGILDQAAEALNNFSIF